MKKEVAGVTFVATMAGWFPGRRWRASCARALTLARWPATARRWRTLALARARCLREEITWHEAPHAVQLAHEETVVVHFAVHVDLVARLEVQLHLLQGW